MLARLGRTCARHHWAVIGVWLVAVVVLGVLAKGSDGHTRDVFTIPGTESQRAVSVLHDSFPAANAATAQVVFRAPSGTLADPAATVAINETVARLAKVPGVTQVSDPTSPLFATTMSSDKRIAYATVAFDTLVTQVPKGTYTHLQEAAAPARAAGLEVQYGGQVIDAVNPPTSAISSHADEIGLAMAVLILLIALGSVASMLMPIALALFALTCSTLLMQIIEAHATIGSVAPVLGTMIGLGVGIDYSLFIVSRHRQNLASGLAPDEAAAAALATSGSAVLFAAITVCIALCGLALVRIPYVTTLGFSAALYVAVAVTAALTLLPAMLGLLGHHVNGWSLPWARRAEAKEAAALAAGEPADGMKTVSGRWAHQVARRPIVFGLVSLVVLVVLALPVFSIHLGIPSDSSAPTATTQYKAYTLLDQGFGPGSNGPLLVVASLPASPKTDPAVAADLERLTTAIAQAPGVARAGPALTDADGRVALMAVTPTTSPTSPATADLVRLLRNHVIPEATRTGSVAADQVLVGGRRPPMST